MVADRLKGRTVREFQVTFDVWSVLGSWAGQTGYLQVEQDQASRTYKRGTGFWVAPQMLKMTWTGAGYKLEAWVWFTLINRIVSLGLMPRELRIESGGFRGVIPRNTSRRDVSALLQMLGQPPVP
jgi:hypothetical protein